MYKCILVGVDLSHGGAGKELVSQAARLLEPGGQIVLVYVMESIPNYVAAELPADLITDRKDEVLQSLQAIAAASGVTARVEARSGGPAPALLESARENEADLIMIASHKPGLQDYFLGSTASRVTRHAPCSVLIAR